MIIRNKRESLKLVIYAEQKESTACLKSIFLLSHRESWWVEYKYLATIFCAGVKWATHHRWSWVLGKVTFILAISAISSSAALHIGMVEREAYFCDALRGFSCVRMKVGKWKLFKYVSSYSMPPRTMNRYSVEIPSHTFHRLSLLEYKYVYIFDFFGAQEWWCSSLQTLLLPYFCYLCF